MEDEEKSCYCFFEYNCDPFEIDCEDCEYYMTKKEYEEYKKKRKEEEK